MRVTAHCMKYECTEAPVARCACPWCVTLREGARFHVCGDPKHRATVDAHHKSLRLRSTEWEAIESDPARVRNVFAIAGDRRLLIGSAKDYGARTEIELHALPVGSRLEIR